MSKTRFHILPDATYILKFDDFNGVEFEVEELGLNILNTLRRTYALDKFIDEETIDEDDLF